MCAPAVGRYKGVVHEYISLCCGTMLTVVIFVLMIFAMICVLAIMIVIYWRIIELTQLMLGQTQ